jgi:hypothetical protein
MHDVPDPRLAAAPPQPEAPDRSSFTDEEWRLLQFAPFWVMTQVAHADGDLDAKEFMALAREMDDASRYKNRLARGVLESCAGEFEAIWNAYKEDPRKVDEGLRDVVQLLDRTLSPADAKGFKIALLGIGHWVADASGGFFGLGDRVSREESQALAFIMELLGITPADVQAAM